MYRTSRPGVGLLALAVVVSGGASAFGGEMVVSGGASAFGGEVLVRGPAAPTVRTLLQAGEGRAADLVAQPALWDWSAPMPTRTAQAALEPAPSNVPSSVPTAQAAPAPEDETDILDEVSVTATRRPTRERDTTATTYAVRKEDFRAQAAATATDALQVVPGFSGLPLPGGQLRSAFFLRGFDDQRFQVLRDGVSLQRPANGATDISRFAVDTLERIEVVTGGATLRYGAGAVGGVINLITETPKGPPKLTLSYEAGSYGYSRYGAKFSGGDDTFSYNLAYSSLVAFNNYPYAFTLPNQAQFYGPTVNPNATVPGRVNPAGYPNGRNSFGVGGRGAGDPDNSGATDLFGFLKPELGPPVTVRGVNDTASNFSENYSGKLSFKPDAVNRVTFDLNVQNYRSLLSNPGNGYRNACFGGASVAANPVLALNQFFPVDRNGNPLPCAQQRYVVRTPTSTQALPFNYNTSLDGSVVFPTGQSYPSVEAVTLENFFYANIDQTTLDLSVLWDHELTPTTSLNSYIAYYRFSSPRSVPQPYFFNSNVELGQPLPGPPGQRAAPFFLQPYSEAERIEVQTALTTQLSPGQTLSFGLNYLEDSSYQQPTVRPEFFDAAIARTSAFLIDDISFGPELKANVGLRYTYSTQFGQVLTPAVGLRYNPDRIFSIRANWSQVYTAPAITNLFTRSAGFLSNANLRPETGITYDLGVDITPAPNLGIRLTYFNTSLDGVIGTRVLRNPNATTPGDPTFGFIFLNQFDNINSRRASGIELATDWQPSDQWRLRLSWTNSDTRAYGLVDDPSQPTFPYFYGYQDPNIAFNTVVLSATYANRGFQTSLLARYESGKRRPNALDFTPAFATVDLNFEVPITTNLTLTGSVLNLTDAQYELLPGAPAPGTTFRLGGRVAVGG